MLLKTYWQKPSFYLYLYLLLDDWPIYSLNRKGGANRFPRFSCLLTNYWLKPPVGNPGFFYNGEKAFIIYRFGNSDRPASSGPGHYFVCPLREVLPIIQALILILLYGLQNLYRFGPWDLCADHGPRSQKPPKQTAVFRIPEFVRHLDFCGKPQLLLCQIQKKDWHLNRYRRHKKQGGW